MGIVMVDVVGGAAIITLMKSVSGGALQLIDIVFYRI